MTFAIGLLGYVGFILNFFILPSAPVVGKSLFDLTVLLIFYGLYFGILARDLVTILSGRMASTIGVISAQRKILLFKTLICSFTVLRQGGYPKQTLAR